MPYITQSRRQPFLPHIELLVDELKNSIADGYDGDVNYVITKILDGAYQLRETRYNKIKDAMGTLACIEHELYHRRAVNYESTKRGENGEVYL